jgi:hypothetical protein
MGVSGCSSLNRYTKISRFLGGVRADPERLVPSYGSKKKTRIYIREEPPHMLGEIG